MIRAFFTGVPNMTTDTVTQEQVFLDGVLDELRRARAKFPTQGVWVTLAALTEEVGELNQAILQRRFEPHKGKTYEGAREEAMQVCTMAMRVIFDCADFRPE